LWCLICFVIIRIAIWSGESRWWRGKEAVGHRGVPVSWRKPVLWGRTEMMFFCKNIASDGKKEQSFEPKWAAIHAQKVHCHSEREIILDSYLD
jgi:hypothetical protein